MQNEESIAGIDLGILKVAASQVLHTTEVPTLADGGDGGFNRLFILEFPMAGKKLLARVSQTHARTPCRIEQAVATMSLARHVRGIPTPQVYAWNASSENPVGAPYIIQEWIEDVVEPWKVFERSTHEQRAVILDDLARWHAAFLAPLPHHLSGVGDLGFAPGVRHDADLSDPRTYTIRPLHSRVFRNPELEELAFKSSTTSFPTLWGELLTLRHNLAFPHGRSHPDRDELWLGAADETSEDYRCDVKSFTTVSSHVRQLVNRVLADLSTNPEFSAPCLVRSDYAFRNILLDPTTLRVKAFIDWDDVHVTPFVLALNFPEDITHFTEKGLDPDATWFQEGCFGALPPDEYGDVVGPFDADGNSLYEDENGNSNGLEYRDQRILNTMYREAYVHALQKYDSRVGLGDLWELRKRMVQARFLLEKGAYTWWSKRNWLAAELERLENGVGR